MSHSWPGLYSLIYRWPLWYRMSFIYRLHNFSPYRQQLNSTAVSVSGGVLAPPTSPAILTADLLQVEAHLQSRVRLLEGERNELVRELERGKLLLSEREERHVAEQAEVRLVHKAAISKVHVTTVRKVPVVLLN